MIFGSRGGYLSNIAKRACLPLFGKIALNFCPSGFQTCPYYHLSCLVHSFSFWDKEVQISYQMSISYITPDYISRIEYIILNTYRSKQFLNCMQFIICILLDNDFLRFTEWLYQIWELPFWLWVSVTETQDQLFWIYMTFIGIL